MLELRGWSGTDIVILTVEYGSEMTIGNGILIKKNI